MTPNNRIRGMHEAQRLIGGHGDLEKGFKAVEAAGIPVSPPFPPGSGQSMMLGPFVRVVAGPIMEEGLAAKTFLRCVAYDVPNHEGVVYQWVLLNPDLDEHLKTNEMLVALANALLNVHEEFVEDLLACKNPHCELHRPEYKAEVRELRAYQKEALA